MKIPQLEFRTIEQIKVGWIELETQVFTSRKFLRPKRVIIEYKKNMALEATIIHNGGIRLICTIKVFGLCLLQLKRKKNQQCMRIYISQ